MGKSEMESDAYPETIPGIKVTRISNGTNVARITLSGVDIPEVRRQLGTHDIILGRPSPEGTITLGVNETWNRTTGEKLAHAFEQAMS